MTRDCQQYETVQRAAAITWAASKQTYYTVRFLVDRERIGEAYLAYAYFRWLDDQLDQELMDAAARIVCLERQKALMESCFRGAWPQDASADERMLVELIQSDPRPNSGLRLYIRNMMDVMAFDAHRRGRLIDQAELTRYSRALAAAVTEALHYFVGHGCAAPRSEARFLAATGAHIAHMLRDTLDDAAAGYFNIPREVLEAHAVAPQDVDSDAYRTWVKGRVQTARACFDAGRDYLAQVANLRCRIAGHAYIGRFTGVLDAIEAEGYRLRSVYSERTSLRAGLSLIGSVLWLAFRPRKPGVSAVGARMKLAEGEL